MGVRKYAKYKDDHRAFLVDAFFYSGSSGAIVLAIRDGVPNYELVGIAVSASGFSEYFLMPEEDEAYDEAEVYRGDVFTKSRTVIDQGITHVMSVEAIRDLIREHRAPFEERGYVFQFLDP